MGEGGNWKGCSGLATIPDNWRFGPKYLLILNEGGTMEAGGRLGRNDKKLL
jgi:hypothetical protein